MDFYKEVSEEAKKPVYRKFSKKAPAALSVKRAFEHAFDGSKGLPELYWRVMKTLLAIDREEFASRSIGAPQFAPNDPSPPPKPTDDHAEMSVKAPPNPPSTAKTTASSGADGVISGAAQPSQQTNLRLNQVLSRPLFIPPVAEQEAIAANLDSTQRLERIYERKLAALKALKEAVLHHALSDGL